MRNLNNLTIDELISNPLTISELTKFMTQWYKQRENDYPDTYKDKKQMKELGRWCYNSWMALLNDNNVKSILVETIEYYRDKNPDYIGYPHKIHSLAKMGNILSK